MNEVILKGIIRDIAPSHVLNNIEYEKANLIVGREDGEDDILPLKFKKFSNRYKDGDKIELIGNLRSYSQKLSNGKNNVNLYVFTYFDTPKTNDEFQDIVNRVKLDGRVCKIDELRITDSGKSNLHLIIANNIISNNSGQKLNNYIPSVMWGKIAIDNSDLKINDKVSVLGKLHSRLYKKKLDNNEIELRMAHELLIEEIEKMTDYEKNI